MDDKQTATKQKDNIKKELPGLPIITYILPPIEIELEVEINLKTITKPKLMRQSNFINHSQITRYNHTNNIMNILERSYK
jgi:hypothetical protein|uniref:Uncharacterized protein n=1 Tax=viral metagenome TaxID=1070528 RepID=A0A6C0IIF5_9ZZZZ